MIKYKPKIDYRSINCPKRRNLVCILKKGPFGFDLCNQDFYNKCPLLKGQKTLKNEEAKDKF